MRGGYRIPKRISLRDFIRAHRATIDNEIEKRIEGARRNDDERRMWILNDEKLYNWARSMGVRI